jgi:MFS transporter, DHA2 family, glioxin efflux transporter
MQSGFVNQMANTAATTAPSVDSVTLIGTGATEIRIAFSADQLHGVLLAYLAGLRVVWAIAISFSGISFAVTGLARWKRLHGATATGAIA